MPRVKKKKEPQSDAVETPFGDEKLVAGVPISLLDGDDDLRRVLSLVENFEPLTFLTGRAGTGKTTAVHYLRAKLPNLNIVTLAPTGVAALNSGGQTIHSFFRFPPRLIQASDIHRSKSKIYEKIQVLILDEVSMVRADVLDGIDLFMKNNGPHLGEPFGGVPVVFVGDLFQLPPVVRETEIFSKLYPTPWFFSARALSGRAISKVELRKVHRQHDPVYVDLLDRARLGHDLDEVAKAFNGRCLDEGDEPEEAVVLCATNFRADMINESRLRSISGHKRDYVGEATGDFKVQGEKDDRLPAPYKLELKIGAQVMFVRNDPNRRFVNGSLGEVMELLDDEVLVRMFDEGGPSELVIGRMDWPKIKYADDGHGKIVAKEVGKYSQIPLILAWALTIHKAQGKTLDRVMIDLGQGAFAPGQAYVALSRARTLQGLRLLRPLTPKDFIVDSEALRFHQKSQ